jgi:uroporphyrinogen III methyltransferase / synthase
MTAGMVYLVGAGPGDPGLITQKGLEALSRADVVVYDNLIDERLLEAASPRAECIFAGKTAVKHTLEQSEINTLLMQKALEGKIVVRLKGGDPFVLGRGGEEGEALAASHVPFEIIPGITSAIAVPAYAGIPVTHRGKASSFAVITGHEDPSKGISGINWEKLTNAVDTLVFLMGIQNLPSIIQKLVENGRDAHTPIAIIQNGTRPEQKSVTGTLQNITQKVKKEGIGSPAVIVVGEVVGLREKLRWFDNQPLFGKRILVTRARHQASALSRLLEVRGSRPIELPLIQIQDMEPNPELEAAISNLAQYNWIIFTSTNGVESFFARLRRSRLDARIFKDIKIGVIGPATASALEQKGLIADFYPEVYTSEKIVEGFRKMGVRGNRILLPRADIADRYLSTELTRLGATVQEIPAYRTAPVSTNNKLLELLNADEIDVVTFTSSSTVANFITAAKDTLQPSGKVNFKAACIGPKTAAAAARAGLRVDILAQEQTIPGLVKAIENYYRKETL